MSQTDCDRLLESLELRGSEGVHSHDIRRWGISGNPSQRVRELKDKGHLISATRENRGKRPGVRYVLESIESSGGDQSEPLVAPALGAKDAQVSGLEPSPQDSTAVALGAPTTSRLIEMEDNAFKNIGPPQYDPFSNWA